MNGSKLNALIDTGSDINAVRECVFKKLGVDSQFQSTTKNVSGAGGAKITANSYFNGKLLIDNQSFTSKIYIVNNNDILTDVLIGNELLFDVQLIHLIPLGEITLNRPKSDIEKEENQLWCMTITEEDEMDILPKTLKKMIKSYKPKQPQNRNHS